MPNHVLDGLSLVDATGRIILASIAATLVLGIALNLWVRRCYAQLEDDLRSATGGDHFSHPLLADVVRSCREAARRSREPNTQAIIERHFQSELRPLLLGERFVRAATGLVIILGLMGTFYGLTLSIGKLVQLVGGDGGGVSDVTQAVTTGLTHALSGMAVAFSNSLLGVASAVVLTMLGVLSNLTDRRVGLMLQIEVYVDRLLSDPRTGGGSLHAPVDDDLGRAVAGFEASVERLGAVVARFESAMSSFSTNTRDFTEFNAHLKDNVQRMSVSFGDLSDTFKTQVLALKRGNGA
jgi:hypothetical protein